jgi:type IV pilus assembly protein PilF
METKVMMKMRLWALVLLGAVLLIQAGCSSTSSAKREKMAEAFHKMGRSYYNNGEYQRAFVEFQKSVESEPDHRDSHYYLGHIYWVRGEYAKAEEEFHKTIKLDPDFSDAHNNLGVLYRLGGKIEQAVSEYKIALSNPRYETPHFARFNLGVAYMDLEKYDAALAEFKKARSIEPSYLQAYLGEARALLKLNRHAEAVEVIRVVLDLEPDNLQGLFLLGVVHYEKGSNPRAREAFNRVVELAPESDLAKNAKEYLGRLP